MAHFRDDDAFPAPQRQTVFSPDLPRPFRPERFVISTELARKLARDGQAVSQIVHHADGTSELVLEPVEPDDTDEPVELGES